MIGTQASGPTMIVSTARNTPIKARSMIDTSVDEVKKSRTTSKSRKFVIAPEAPPSRFKIL